MDKRLPITGPDGGMEVNAGIEAEIGDGFDASAGLDSGTEVGLDAELGVGPGFDVGTDGELNVEFCVDTEGCVEAEDESGAGIALVCHGDVWLACA